MTTKTSAASLALRPREAAAALGVSARTLWTWTSEGRIPHLRMGRTLLYPVAELEAWLRRQADATKAGETSADAAKGGDHDPRS